MPTKASAKPTFRGSSETVRARFRNPSPGKAPDQRCWIASMQSAIEYIQEKGFEHRVQSRQAVLKVCPFCGDENYHFYVDQNEGPFFCHKCNKKGNLITLKKHFGDNPGNGKQEETILPAFQKPKPKAPNPGFAEKYHQALLKQPETLKYLHDRGINQDSIDRFKIGFYQKNGTSFISIPHFQNGQLQNIKFRSLPPAEKTFRRIPDCKSILFNTDAVKKYSDSIIITEGELDAITLIQAGLENVVSGTTGAGSFGPDWIGLLKPVKKIYLAYDADAAGQDGARSLAKRLGYNRTFNIELPPGQDVNDFFQSNGVDEFKELFHQAKPFDLPGVYSINRAIEFLITEKQRLKGNDAGIKTPWPKVDQLIKNFGPGDLIILSAPPKTGKTTFALNIATDAAMDGNAILFYCLEMRAERLALKVLQSTHRKEQFTVQEIEKIRKDFEGFPLYFGHSFKKQKLDDIVDAIREAIKRYDLKLVVFDNLHFLIRSISNVNEELGQAVQAFKLLAEEMEIPIIAIAQSRKRETGGKDEIMRADDIKYSNAVHADCDMMIIMHRARVASKPEDIDKDNFTGKTESLDPITLIRIEAHRYGAGGETLLYYHGEYSKFDEMKRKGR